MQPWPPGSTEGQEKAQRVSAALGPLDGVAGAWACHLRSGQGPWSRATRAGREERDPNSCPGLPTRAFSCVPGITRHGLLASPNTLGVWDHGWDGDEVTIAAFMRRALWAPDAELNSDSTIHLSTHVIRHCCPRCDPVSCED